MKMIRLAKLVLSVLLMGATVALAGFDPVNDDTDIFLANPNITAERPNVLIIVDNTANWNQPFTNEKNALVQVINGLTDQYNVGLMIMSNSNWKRNGSGTSDGSFVRYAVRQMTATNKTYLTSIIGNFDVLADKGDNNMAGMALYESYLYFGNLASRAGDDQSKADFDGTTDPNLSPLSAHALPSPSTLDGFPAVNGVYRSPITDGCQRNFVIFISNGPANENASARSELQGYLSTLTGVNPPNVIAINPNGQQGNWADEMARYMANADVLANTVNVPNNGADSRPQNVYTYVVEVDPGTTGQGPDMTALAKSMAVNGKGKYFGVSSSASGTAIVDALNAIFSEVQAVNSVFASTTLPVSVNVRGTNLNQVYIGVFRPDPNKLPRWLGNLKMYNLQLNTATNTVFLADATNGPPPAVGNAAENTTTGFVSQSASSFWTTNSTFWGYRDPSLNGVGGPSDKPDGDLVEKGGAAEQLRINYAAAESSSPARNLYTCTTGAVSGVSQDCQPQTGFQLSRTPFQTTNAAITAGSLNLDTRAVSPLTAYQAQNVVSITDRPQVQSFTNNWSGVYVTSMVNGATTRQITSLNTSLQKVVTSVTSDVPNTQSVAITNITKSGANFIVTAAAAIPSNFINTPVAGSPKVTIAGNSVAAYNTSWTLANLNTGAKTFTINASGNPGTGTGGTATMTNGIATSTTAVVTLANHGFTSGQAVTISGATPGNYNGTFNVTVIDANTFKYTMLTAPSTAGNATGTIYASGNTTTATATVSSPWPSTFSGTVNVSGASDPAYNGAKSVLGTPAPSTTQFSYSVGSTPIGPNTNSVGVTVSQGGSTTVTVTTSGPHGFTNGQSISISGSDINGYNGSFTISCPTAAEAALGACTSTSGHTQFTFTTSTVLPANSSTNVFASAQASPYIFVYSPHHGLKEGDQVAIELPSNPTDQFARTYTVHYTGGSDDWLYLDARALCTPGPSVPLCPSVTQSGYTMRPTGGINDVTGAPGTQPLAYVYLPAHGYPNSQQVRIDGANPTGYNGIYNIQLCDQTATQPARQTGLFADLFTGYTGFNAGVATYTTSCFLPYSSDRFNYTLSAAVGANTSTAVTSSIKTTTARATSVNHGFTNGSTVSISGAVPSAFNGASITITVVDANTFTYTLPSPQGDASGTILAAQAGGPSAERDQIIKWIRGEDNFEDENQNSSLADIRASVHGDVLHSRPAVVNYNRTGTDDDVYIFYGANDGVFHAVKGGYTNSDSAGNAPGREVWGFVAQEFFPQLRRLRNDAPTISSSFKKPYFMDGSIGVLTNDANGNGKLGDSGDTVNLYISNRRGGRFVYALDVNNPLDPKYLWKIDTSTTGFAELGYSWSQPTVVPTLATLSVPVVVFGAGYDPTVEDIDPSTVTSVNTTNGAVTTAAGTFTRSMGRGIYVANALTGELIWSVGGTGSGATIEVSDMVYAIPSDVTVVRNESGGAPNRAYVGDTGGNVWRIDFKSDPANPSPNLDLTKVTKLASLADQSTAAGRRKFLFPPDVVGQTGYDAVLIGSGDREHPFDTTVTNRFYMLKDKGGDAAPSTGRTTSEVAGVTSTTTTLCDPIINEGTVPDLTDSCPPTGAPIPGLTDLTSDCLQDASACLAGETQAALTTKLGTDRGWFITLQPGEKVVGSSISLGGTTFFNTNTPSSTAGGGACGSNLGVARQYQVSTVDATATSNLNAVSGLNGADRFLVHAGGGYLPSPVQVVVTLEGKPVQAVISGIQVSTPAGATLSSRLRKYWYKEVDTK